MYYYYYLSHKTHLDIIPTTNGHWFFAVTTAVPSPATRSFQAIIALIGYLGNACNMLIYPYAVELCVTYCLHGMSARPYVIAKDMCFVLIGLLVFACGTYAVTARLIVDVDWRRMKLTSILFIIPRVLYIFIFSFNYLSTIFFLLCR